jgi:hypothetical protein
MQITDNCYKQALKASSVFLFLTIQVRSQHQNNLEPITDLFMQHSIHTSHITHPVSKQGTGENAISITGFISYIIKKLECIYQICTDYFPWN